ncbi:MAG TPA: aspartate/glutamate racemase family protein [Acetobacteraceae bacterium]|jgi:Asp/Glu/hydantoin racemase
MPPILLINPNTSLATTEMMVTQAQSFAGARWPVHGATATRGPAMITTPEDLDAAEAEVIAIADREARGCSGVIVAAFGDPGVAPLRVRLAVPVVGICEAAMYEAAALGRFAVATTTPALVQRIADSAARLGLGAQYVGTWLTGGDPLALTGDPPALQDALARAVAACLSEANVASVIIGGGPLSRAAEALSGRFAVQLIAPVAASVRWLLCRLGA